MSTNLCNKTEKMLDYYVKRSKSVYITRIWADKKREGRKLSAREGRKSEKGANYPLEETKWPGEKPEEARGKARRSQEAKKAERAKRQKRIRKGPALPAL